MKKDSFVRLTLIAILLIQIVVILNIRPWKNAEKQNALINWDVTSYYSYLPAVFVHQDLKFNFLKNSPINYAIVSKKYLSSINLIEGFPCIFQ